MQRTTFENIKDNLTVVAGMCSVFLAVKELKANPEPFMWIATVIIIGTLLLLIFEATERIITQIAQARMRKMGVAKMIAQQYMEKSA